MESVGKVFLKKRAFIVCLDFRIFFSSWCYVLNASFLIFLILHYVRIVYKKTPSNTTNYLLKNDSTVGYGSSSPALGYQNDNPEKCFFVSLLCAIESLHGVLFSGFCGAILFGKILRIQSRAQVRFSDAVLIRYGKGLKSHFDQKANPNVGQEPCGDSDDDDDADEEQGVNNESSGFPVLEFRVMNLLFDKVGGEIVDAHINVVANINAIDDLDHSVHGINPADFYSAATAGDESNGTDPTDTATSTPSNASTSTISTPGVPLMRRFESSRRNLSSGSANSRRNLSSGSGNSRRNLSSGSSESSTSTNRRNLFSAYPGSVSRRNLMSSSDGGDVNSTHHRAFFAAIEEHEMIVASKTAECGEPTADCKLHEDVFEKQKKRLFSVGKQVFMKVHLKAQDHPLFKRVWLLSHMLDLNSPLLKPKVKHEIMANNGRWPSKYNAVDDIRDCIQFNQILVSLHGVANYSASDTYAQKI